MLPWPVSTNRYWRSFVPRGGKRAIVTVSPEALQYKRQAAWLAKEARLKPLRGLVQLEFTLYPANGVCMDLDNALKVAIDALNGVAYFDDSQIRRLVAERAEPNGVARLEVEISEYVPPPAPIFRDTGSAIANVRRETSAVPF